VARLEPTVVQTQNNFSPIVCSTPATKLVLRVPLALRFGRRVRREAARGSSLRCPRAARRRWRRRTRWPVRKERAESRSCSAPLPPSYGGIDLSQEGRVSLPNTPAALSWLGLAYSEAAVDVCDAALAAAGGRGSLAATDSGRVPSLKVEAQARGYLGICLNELCKGRQPSLELLWQAVALRRQVARAAPDHDTLSVQWGLADQLTTLGLLVSKNPFKEVAEAEACLREALALGDNLGDVQLKVRTLRFLINLSGEAGATLGPAEAEAFRSRLSELLLRMGREPETSCSICLEPLAPPANGAVEDAASSGASRDVGDPPESCVRALACNHQFHHGCIMSWRCTTANFACPLCKE